jgi:hypothetical protein
MSAGGGLNKRWLVFFFHGTTHGGKPEYTGDSFDKYGEAETFVQSLLKEWEAQRRPVTFLILRGGLFPAKIEPYTAKEMQEMKQTFLDKEIKLRKSLGK